MTLRILPYAAGDGPANMAIDEAMLEATAREGSAYLRFYGWTEPTLSLGYFQRIAEVRDDPRWLGRPIVRRPTGGGAIWHHHEVTYAIAVPPSCPLVRPSTALYRAVHGAIAGVLGGYGLPARRRGEGDDRKRPFLCFTGGDPEDIVVSDHKMVGSAQRRRGGAVLQHGSILLARSPDVPELLGAGDVADIPMSPEDWDAPLARAIIGAVGLEAVPVDMPHALRDHARELERTRYRERAWTEAR